MQFSYTKLMVCYTVDINQHINLISRRFGHNLLTKLHLFCETAFELQLNLLAVVVRNADPYSEHIVRFASAFWLVATLRRPPNDKLRCGMMPYCFI